MQVFLLFYYNEMKNLLLLNIDTTK